MEIARGDDEQTGQGHETDQKQQLGTGAGSDPRQMDDPPKCRQKKKTNR